MTIVMAATTNGVMVVIDTVDMMTIDTTITTGAKTGETIDDVAVTDMTTEVGAGGLAAVPIMASASTTWHPRRF